MAKTKNVAEPDIVAEANPDQSTINLDAQQETPTLAPDLTNADAATLAQEGEAVLRETGETLPDPGAMNIYAPDLSDTVIPFESISSQPPEVAATEKAAEPEKPPEQEAKKSRKEKAAKVDKAETPVKEAKAKQEKSPKTPKVAADKAAPAQEEQPEPPQEPKEAPRRSETEQIENRSLLRLFFPAFQRCGDLRSRGADCYNS